MFLLLRWQGEGYQSTNTIKVIRKLGIWNPHLRWLIFILMLYLYMYLSSIFLSSLLCFKLFHDKMIILFSGYPYFKEDPQRLCFRCVVVGVGIVLIVIMMIINVVNVKAFRRRTRKTNINTQPVVWRRFYLIVHGRSTYLWLYKLWWHISAITCLWWHISAITCQIIMLTRQIFMSSCHIFMMTCHLFIC